MIKSGRNSKNDTIVNITESRLNVRITTVLGVAVFAIFLCVSLNGASSEKKTAAVFGEGAYQVFATASADSIQEDEEAAIYEDPSVWGYLESVIEQFIYGER